MTDLHIDFVKSTIIPIPKKTAAKKYEQYHTISLISQTLNILCSGEWKKMGDTLSEEKFEFKKNKGTREAILALRIIEKRIRKDKPTFIDLLIFKRYLMSTAIYYVNVFIY